MLRREGYAIACQARKPQQSRRNKGSILQRAQVYSLSSWKGQPRHSSPSAHTLLCPCPQEQQDAGQLQVPPSGWLLGHYSVVQCWAVVPQGRTIPVHLCFQLLISITVLLFLLALAPHVHSGPSLWVSIPCCSSTADHPLAVLVLDPPLLTLSPLAPISCV